MEYHPDSGLLALAAVVLGNHLAPTAVVALVVVAAAVVAVAAADTHYYQRTPAAAAAAAAAAAETHRYPVSVLKTESCPRLYPLNTG